MPFVRIDLREGTSAADRRAIADAVHQALVETMGVPADDRFQVISEHTREGLIYDQTYLGIARTDAVIFIQITLSVGRKPAQKRALYARITELLTREPGVRAQDIVINLVEVAWENWSFGDGEAQYTQ